MLKRFIMSVALFALTAIPVLSAASAKTADPFNYEFPQYKAWTFFQLGLFPMVPEYTKNSAVDGIKTGWPMCTGHGIVNGFECSWLYSGTHYINGVQASIFMNESRHLIGFEPAVAINLNTRTLEGFQASCLLNIAGNLRGFQAGGLNIARSIDGMQAGVLGNITREMSGFQTGLFCAAKELYGVQFSIANSAKSCDKEWGFQFGLVNVISGKKGIQFGLVNVIANGTVPFLPFFNISL